MLSRVVLGRIVFVFILLSLLNAYGSHTMLHQLRQPVLTFPYVDPVYWAAHLVRIPEMLTQHSSLALCFDVLLTACCLLCVLFPARRGFVAAFLILFFLYFITFNSYGAHHTHSKVGLLLMPIPFLFRREQAFALMWQVMRYNTLFIFSCAFFWKLVRFSVDFPEQGMLIVRRNLAPYLYFNGDTWLAEWYTWLLQHPGVTGLLFICGFLLEGSFLTGFFTRKWDRFLFAASLLLVLGFYFMADASFAELLIFSITLLCMPAAKQAVK